MTAKQLPLPLPHRAALGRDDFFVAPSNAEAVAAIDSWPRWSVPALVLTGPAGSGKTHLCAVFSAASGAVMCAAKDMRVDDVPHLAQAPAVIIEDIDSGDFDERALFHLYNMVSEQGGHLLITGRKPPRQWPVKLADLVSRLLAALHLQLGVPDDDLLNALIRKHLSDRQIRLRDEALVPYLISHIERSADAAKAVVTELDALALASGRRVGLKLAVELLERTESSI